jgi:hypothetical protein
MNLWNRTRSRHLPGHHAVGTLHCRANLLVLSAFFRFLPSALCFLFYLAALHGNAPASANDAIYRVSRRAFSGWSARYFFITRTIRIALSPLGTHASRSLLGTPSSSSRTRKPSVKPPTQPRHIASRHACSSETSRPASRFPSPSFSTPAPFSDPPPFSSPTLEQTSSKSLPDRLISLRERQSPDWRPLPPVPGIPNGVGSSTVFFGVVLAGQPTSKKPISTATISRRTAASHHVARFYASI